MIVYPAIDLRNSQCVRLYQGDYEKETIYHAEPLMVVSDFVSAGAKWLHIVDLDGAKDPTKTQASLIATLIKNCDVQVQTGGGIRTKEQVKRLLDAGVGRVIVGSLAVKNSHEVAKWVEFFGADRLVLAVDVMFDIDCSPFVAIDGWQTTSRYRLTELIEFYQQYGLKHILCTDIARDGTLHGPNHALYSMLSSRYPELQVQASGGIGLLSDLEMLRMNRTAGAIIGRALYENKFSLREALLC